MITGLLIDIDGVLITGNKPLPGALNAIHYLNNHHVPYLLVTNTTRKSRINIWHQLKRLGFPINESHLFTASMAAVQFLREKKISRIHLLLSGSALHDFKEFKITAGNPEYLVIGDLGADLTYEKLNSAFRLVMGGTRMVALQKNRYWQTSSGLSIDAGAIVAALEFATGKRAQVVGKPRKQFFLQAVQLLNREQKEVVMIGDDLESDIEGAQRAGLRAWAVKTGKFRQYVLQKTKIKPDKILESIADLPAILQKQTEK